MWSNTLVGFRWLRLGCVELYRVVQNPDGCCEECILEPTVKDSQAPVPSFQWYSQDESMAKVEWGFDAISCLLEAVPSVDPVSGGETNTCDRLGNVHHFLPSPLFLSIQIYKPGCDATSGSALHHTLVEGSGSMSEYCSIGFA